MRISSEGFCYGAKGKIFSKGERLPNAPIGRWDWGMGAVPTHLEKACDHFSIPYCKEYSGRGSMGTGGVVGTFSTHMITILDDVYNDGDWR